MSDELYDLYKPVRNYIRNFDPNEIINFCINVFSQNIDNKHPTEWTYQPNLTALIIRWTLLEWEVKSKYKILNSKEFNKIYSDIAKIFEHINPNIEENGVHNFLSRMLQSQIFFQLHQKQVEAGIGRQRIIFKEIGGAKIEGLYNEYSNINIHEYMNVITTLWAMSFTNKQKKFTNTYFSNLTQNNNILEKLSCDINEGKRFIRSQLYISKNSKIIKNIDFQMCETTPLIKKPLFKNKNSYKPYSKHLLSYFIIYGLYDYFKSKESNFSSTHFGQIFEEYIEKCLNYSKLEYITNRQFQKSTKKNLNCDFIVEEEQNIIFIEAKSTELNPFATVTRQDNIIIKNIEDTITKAIKQIQMTAKNYDTENIQNLYGIIITYKDYLIGNTNEIYKKIQINENIEISVPLENMVMITIEDFEYIVSGILDKKICLSNIIQFIIENNKNNQNSKLLIRDHLRKLFGSLSMPEFLNEEFDKQFKEIDHALKNPPE